jgi:hypothetical protein
MRLTEFWRFQNVIFLNPSAVQRCNTESLFAAAKCTVFSVQKKAYSNFRSSYEKLIRDFTHRPSA